MTASGREAEVRLGVSANILADIVLNPGSIDFGTVMKGQARSQVLTIDRIGAPGWRFERMVSASRVLSAQLVESRRNAKGDVSYTLTVGIKPDAPAGPLRDEIRLLSNDRETPSIPVMVTAWVRGDLTAAPSVLSLGEADWAAAKAGPVHRPGLAPVRDQVHRRSRRRLFDGTTRRHAQIDARSDSHLQAR